MDPAKEPEIVDEVQSDYEKQKKLYELQYQIQILQNQILDAKKRVNDIIGETIDNDYSELMANEYPLESIKFGKSKKKLIEYQKENNIAFMDLKNAFDKSRQDLDFYESIMPVFEDYIQKYKLVKDNKLQTTVNSSDVSFGNSENQTEAEVPGTVIDSVNEPTVPTFDSVLGTRGFKVIEGGKYTNEQDNPVLEDANIVESTGLSNDERNRIIMEIMNLYNVDIHQAFVSGLANTYQQLSDEQLEAKLEEVRAEVNQKNNLISQILEYEKTATDQIEERALDFVNMSVAELKLYLDDIKEMNQEQSISK